jgi:Fur family ferric uptake transcriptional regulator
VTTVSPTWAEEALARLRESGLRSGGARRAVVHHLGRQDCCLSAQEIFDGIRAGGDTIGIASVYRVLDTLAALRLVQRVEFGDGVTRFEPAREGVDHHHHVVCDDCGSVEAFADPSLERTLERVAARLDYTMQAHEVVLHGVCPRCRDGRPVAAGSGTRR